MTYYDSSFGIMLSLFVGRGTSSTAGERDEIQI